MAVVRWTRLYTLGVGLLTLACGGGGGGGTTPPGPPARPLKSAGGAPNSDVSNPLSTGLSVGDDIFTPGGAVIKTGGAVTWTWAGARVHNVTFPGGPTPRPANGPNQMSGTYTTPAIKTVGTYSYVCTNHAGMNGTLTVVH